jgi:hypothetical protein
MRLFVAGATGAVGFEFVRLAKAEGFFIHMLSRKPENVRKLAGLADQVEVQAVCTGTPSLGGIDAVVSTLGPPVTLNSPEKRPCREVELLEDPTLRFSQAREKAADTGHVGAVLISEVRDQVHLLYARASREDREHHGGGKR